MTETPLAPNNIESRVGIVVTRGVPKPLQSLCTLLRLSWIETLKGPLEERYALGSIFDTSPSGNVAFVVDRGPLTPSMCLFYKRLHWFEKDDVRDEVKKDVSCDASDPCTDVESAKSLWGFRICWSERTDRGRERDDTELWDEIEEELAGTERIDTG